MTETVKLTRKELSALRKAEQQRTYAAAVEAEKARKESLIKSNNESAAGRMLRILARAEVYDKILTTSFIEQESGDFVLRVFNDSDYGCDELSFVSQDWQFESVEKTLDDLDQKAADERKRRVLAQETYDRLTQEERDALGLTYRPC